MRALKSNFAGYITDFITYRRSLGYAASTYETLAEFDDFCARLYPDERIITKELAWVWMKRKPTEGRSGQTQRVSRVRMLGKYLNAIGVAAYIIPEGVVTDRRNFTPYMFTDSELSALFGAATIATADCGYKCVSIAIPVIFRLIYACGLRPFEARLLPCGNINLNNGEILVSKTKRNRERIVVMSDETTVMCREYAKERDTLYTANRWFFPRADGEAFTSRELKNVFNWCWEKANPQLSASLLPAVRSYDLRHRFASTVLLRWMNEGRNLQTMLPRLQAYMGHEQLEGTAYYIHLLPENLQQSAGISWDAMAAILPEVSAWQK